MPGELGGGSRPADRLCEGRRAVERDLALLGDRDPGAVGRPRGISAKEPIHAAPVVTRQLREADAAESAEWFEQCTTVRRRQDRSPSLRNQHRPVQSPGGVVANESLAIFDDRERTVRSVMHEGDAAIGPDNRATVDDEPVADRVGDSIVGGVRDWAVGKPSSRPADLKVEAGTPPSAPADALPVRAPDDDAEEGAIAAKLPVRLPEICDPERCEAVPRGRPEAVGEALACRRSPERARSREARQRSLHAAAESHDPHAAVAFVGEDEGSAERPERPSGRSFLLGLGARQPGRRCLLANGCHGWNPALSSTPANGVRCGKSCDQDDCADDDEITGFQGPVAILPVS